MSVRVAGVDGCRGGWIVALHDPVASALELFRIGTIDELAERHPDLAAVAIDMPIGLPERTGPRGRTPERLVRPLLGDRQSSVFSIPARSAVYAALDTRVPDEERFRHCCAVARATSAENKAVARQSFAIFPKIAELDQWLRADPARAARTYECHPEVSFWAMNGERPLTEPKKVKQRPWPAGLALRQQLLQRQGFDSALLTADLARRLGAGLDDLIDACAASWTARRIAEGCARSFPDPPERDAFQLPIAIWA